MVTTYGGELEVNNGKFQGDVTVDAHASLVVRSASAYFDGKLTFEPYGSGMLTNGNYKHIITKGATLGKLSNNTLDVFYIGEDYQPKQAKTHILRLESTSTILATAEHARAERKPKRICRWTASEVMVILTRCWPWRRKKMVPACTC